MSEVSSSAVALMAMAFSDLMARDVEQEFQVETGSCSQ
jgi:hypothetical protein